MDAFEVRFEGRLQNVPAVTTQNYQPRGGTPLRDAIGRTITHIGSVLAKRDESERPENVIIVITTDGEENASRQFTQEQIASLIKQQQEQYNWKFVFLAANQDAILTAASYNLPQASSVTYNSSNPLNAFAVATSAVNFTRSSNKGYTVSDAERKDALADKVSK
jgi:Mg-chelatase subunit ChlD